MERLGGSIILRDKLLILINNSYIISQFKVIMYTIWHDLDYDFARWVYLNSSLSSMKEKTILKPIPKKPTKKALLSIFEKETDIHILPFIKYETPDIIIQRVDDVTNTSEILLVTEFMTHTPQHHHPLQRFSRIYGSSHLKVLSVLVIPKVKVKIERRNDVYRPVSYRANPLIYDIFLRTTKLNHIPTLLLFWPEKGGYLKYNKNHPTAPFIDSQIQRWFDILNETLVRENSDYFQQDTIKNQLELMRETSNLEEETQEELVQNWREFYKLTTLRLEKTSDVISEFDMDTSDLNSQFLENEKTVVFEPDGLSSPSSYFRTDPYAGMLCAFDNLICRNDKGQRNINLVLRATNVEYKRTNFQKFNHNKENCPFINEHIAKKMRIKELDEHLNDCMFTSSKQQRIYSNVADIIVFDDHLFVGESGL